MYLKVAAGFFGKGNVASKILAIVLTSVALAFFALSSMAFTFREFDYLAYNYGYFLEKKPYLVFFKDLPGDTQFLSREQIEYIESELSIRFLTAYGTGFSPLDCYYDFVVEQKPDVISKYGKLNSRHAVQADEALYHEMGYELLEGRYPVETDEIVLSKQVFEGFVYAGFANSVGEDESGEPIYERVEIKSYADLIGREIMLNRTLGTFTVTGIFDDEKAMKMDEGWDEPLPTSGRDIGCAPLLYSEKFVQENYGKDAKNSVNYIFVPVTKEMTKLKMTKKIIQVSQHLFEESIKDGTVIGNISVYQKSIGAVNWSKLLTFGTYESQSNEMGRAKNYARILGVVCAAVMAFAFVLDVYLVTDIVFSRRRQIGVLQALGYRRGKIAGMMLGAVFLLSLFIFLTALLFTVTLYYSWFRPMTSLGSGVLFEFTYETALILFLSSVAVPLLSAAIPILMFFKKPIVENIKARE